MATVLVVGSSGQLAFDLLRHWRSQRPEDRIVGASHAEIEVSDLESVRRVLTQHTPDVVINTAAYHKVDIVEDDPDGAFTVNGSGARNLALACSAVDAVLVQLSTDYVFSGRQRRPYQESDQVEPVSVYGVSKVAGEMLVRFLWPKHFIVRSSGLYGVAGSSGKGGNFVETMLRLAQSGQPVRVVDDQVVTPTHTTALAAQIAKLVTTDAYGTYHATCQGECSWYEFAAEIFRQMHLSPPLERQTTAGFGARAARPPYSVLENHALQQLGIDVMPPWQQGLSEYLTIRAGAAAATP